MERMEEKAENFLSYKMLLITLVMLLLIYISTYIPGATIRDIELSDECYIENTKDDHNNKLNLTKKSNKVPNPNGIYCKTKMRMKYAFPAAYYFTRWMNLD